MKRPSMDDLKVQRDGSLHPRLPGHTYEGERCPKCSGSRTYRSPGSPFWVCRDCRHGFVVVAGQAAEDIGVKDGTALTAEPLPPDSEEE